MPEPIQWALVAQADDIEKFIPFIPNEVAKHADTVLPIALVTL